MTDLAVIQAKEKFYNRFELIIKISSAVLVFTYGFLKFKDIPVQEFINPIVGGYLIRISIILYFAAFIYGANYDLKFHRRIMSRMNLTFKATPFMYFITFLHISLFALLCATNNVITFLIALFIFKLSDNFAVIIIKRNFVNSKSIESIKKNSQNSVYLRRSIDIFQDYFNCDSRRYRIYYDLLFSMILIVFSILEKYIPYQNAYLLNLNVDIIPLLVLFYITISEIWILLLRFKLLIQYDFLVTLEKEENN